MRPRKWTETAIKSAFDSFIKENNRLPTNEEMYKKYNGNFPRPLSVKLALGITLEQYFKKYYTVYYERKRAKIYEVQTTDYWVDDFKKQYLQYNCPSEETYNKMRNPNTPNTQTLAKIIGVSTWREVLNYCKLSVDNKKEMVAEICFDKTLENYQLLANILKNFIEKQ